MLSFGISRITVSRMKLPPDYRYVPPAAGFVVFEHDAPFLEQSEKNWIESFSKSEWPITMFLYRYIPVNFESLLPAEQSECKPGGGWFYTPQGTLTCVGCDWSDFDSCGCYTPKGTLCVMPSSLRIAFCRIVTKPVPQMLQRMQAAFLPLHQVEKEQQRKRLREWNIRRHASRRLYSIPVSRTPLPRRELTP